MKRKLLKERFHPATRTIVQLRFKQRVQLSKQQSFQQHLAHMLCP
jgi:hypothetical protein